MKNVAWMIFIAFLAMISAAGACEECHKITVPTTGDVVNTSDADVTDGVIGTTSYSGGVVVVNCGHNLGVPLMYVNFTEPYLTAGQVDSGLMVDGWLECMIISDAGIWDANQIGNSKEPIFVFTGGYKNLSGEQSVRVVPSESGTTVYYEEIGIEVFQPIDYPDVRIRAIDGGDIVVLGGVELSGLKEIWVYDP